MDLVELIFPIIDAYVVLICVKLPINKQIYAILSYFHHWMCHL
jgi:hypothetical protein